MIDVARAFAILLVLCVHTAQTTGSNLVALSPQIANGVQFLKFGASGVGLFFVISGFLLDLLYGHRSFTPARFWTRRLARIYPAWIFWTIVAVVASYAPAEIWYEGGAFYGGAYPLDSLRNVGITLFHLSFLGFLIPMAWNSFIPGGWSIQVEMFNYALYPLIRGSKFWLIILGAIMLEATQALLLGPLALFPSPVPRAIFETYMTSPIWFVAGIFLSRAVYDWRNNIRWSAVRSLETCLMALCIGFAILTNLSGPFVSQATTFAVVSIAIASAYLVTHNRRVKFLTVIGKYSYGIYFSHFLFLIPLGWATGRLLETFGPTSTKYLSPLILVISYLVLLAGSLLVSRITFLLFERRAIDWARRRTRIAPVEEINTVCDESETTGVKLRKFSS